MVGRASEHHQFGRRLYHVGKPYAERSQERQTRPAVFVGDGSHAVARFRERKGAFQHFAHHVVEVELFVIAQVGFAQPEETRAAPCSPLSVCHLRLSLPPLFA